MSDNAPTTTLDSYFKLPEIKAIAKVSTSTIYRWMEEGTFPKPIKMSRNCVRWRAADVRAWQNAFLQERAA